jgi:acetyl-CoA decarbonylase/synthase, CODH/ACS complex subunit gamma
MALTGIAIYKKLPKKNCGECGVPTCLAFAMNLAAGRAELDSCPYVSEEVKTELAEASAPPIRTVSIGSGGSEIKAGGETVMFRHEKTFVNRTGIAVLVEDTETEEQSGGKLSRLKELSYERVGLTLKADMAALKNSSGDKEKFCALVKKARETGAALILIGENSDNISAALDICAEDRPLVHAASAENSDSFAELALKHSVPLAVRGETLDEAASVAEGLIKKGVKDLVIDSGARTLGRMLSDNVIARRSALMKKFAPLGFPTIAFPCAMTDDMKFESMIAGVGIAKYAGIIVLSDLKGESLFPLLLERLNIFTDPQRPMATKEGIYEINNPDENSPVLVTSNFALTYFVVSGEIESSRQPAWLLVQDTEGLSVLTAWAADKFVAQTIAPFVKKSGISEKVKHRNIVIPGYVVQISGELEEELPDWKVVTGPREAAHLPGFLKGNKP